MESTVFIPPMTIIPPLNSNAWKKLLPSYKFGLVEEGVRDVNVNQNPLSNHSTELVKLSTFPIAKIPFLYSIASKLALDMIILANGFYELLVESKYSTEINWSINPNPPMTNILPSYSIAWKLDLASNRFDPRDFQLSSLGSNHSTEFNTPLLSSPPMASIPPLYPIAWKLYLAVLKFGWVDPRDFQSLSVGSNHSTEFNIPLLLIPPMTRIPFLYFIAWKLDLDSDISGWLDARDFQLSSLGSNHSTELNSVVPSDPPITKIPFL